MRNLISALSQSSIGFALVNTDGKILFWNTALETLTSIKSSAIINKSIWNFHEGLLSAIFPSDKYKEERLQHCYKNGCLPIKRASPTIKFESSFKKEDGSIVPLEVENSIFIMRTKMLRIHRPLLMISFYDLSSQKKKEEEKERIDRERGHDLKIALNNIIGLSELIIDESDPLPLKTVKDFSERINQNAYHLNGLIDAYPQMEKMEKGNFELEKLPIKIEDFMRKINPLKSYFKRQYNVSLEISCSIAETEIYIQTDLFLSVIENLLKNAAEAKPSDQKILLLIRDSSEGIAFTVENQGALSLEAHNSLFQKYTTSGKICGTGLGLYHARLILEAHKGSIRNTSNDKYVSFTFEIPCQV